ncbi:hypothetical protein ACIQMR_37790 [Streptomyces sp. NPDC091376]|uniref:hypothetical protein n=1 Tax=Streptomyces sp. NPDC091376 TaxID=3365994 RepID=UPI0038208610
MWADPGEQLAVLLLRSEHGPEPRVQVRQDELQNSNYGTICETFGGGYESTLAWQALGNLLAHRPGWHFDFDFNHGEVTWCLGALDEAVLVIHVNKDLQYHCYDHRRDTDTVTSDIAAVETWLDGREDIARRPTATLIEYARVSRWQTLKTIPITLRISWSDGYFSATAYHRDEASFGRTLPEAANRAAEMICHLLGAPIELAKEMNLSAELDASAIGHIRTA